MKSVARYMFFWIICLGFLVLSAVVLAILFSPRPDFQVIAELMDETSAGVFGARESTIVIRLSCVSPKSFIAPLTIRTTLLVGGVEVGALRWPAFMWTENSAVYHRDTKKLGVRVEEGTYVRLPEEFLIDGTHTVTIESFQMSGRLPFILEMVREKSTEYKMTVANNAIVSIEPVDIGDVR